MKVGIIVAINELFKLAVPSIQHYQSNWECSFKITLRICFFFILNCKSDQNSTHPHKQVISKVPACIGIK